MPIFAFPNENTYNNSVCIVQFLKVATTNLKKLMRFPLETRLKNLSVLRCRSIFQNIQECSEIFQNIPNYSKILQNILEYSKIFQNISKYFRMSKNIQDFNKGHIKWANDLGKTGF